jgi:putative transposase
VTTVDLGVNNLAVAVAFEGAKRKDTLFVSGRQHEERRFRRLHAIAVRQRKTGCRPKRGSHHSIWRRIRAGKEAVARQTARRMADVAKENGIQVIVFESRSRMGTPRRTGWMTRQNLRRSYWMRGKMMHWVRHMALHEGILVVTRDAQFTSQACPRCGHLGARFCAATHHHRRGKDVFRSYACGWTGNADLVGALNVRLTNRRRSRQEQAMKTGPNRRGA